MFKVRSQNIGDTKISGSVFQLPLSKGPKEKRNMKQNMHMTGPANSKKESSQMLAWDSELTWIKKQFWKTIRNKNIA